ncbi:DUF5339 domain-containing protein [Escherichia coli]|uniref:DUF5339 domain-containing protein n=1 Tax=Escherichia coli TaxID=562 RepID=A0A828P7M7_ECOLX|nr:DUF5339 domain-containing protein [Escherichia coli]EEU2031423.1 DUF5339 domain-containing protein [Escherichia coli]EEW5074848.1 DUF5339 domain-containing protein [Escherichia coli]EEY2486860.1 DUF5339 domain-containing protein [Escherichia coli]EFA9656700.1 DUF5339 domain-containing protein [Escherichia coli]EFE9533493.1 DUF5339 domain-containing protein [Escherichia coli]
MRNIFALLVTVISCTTASAAMTETCQKYFDETDKFLSQMKTTGVADEQINLMKQQYEQSKKQFSSLPEASQDAACKQASDALKQSMNAAKIK